MSRPILNIDDVEFRAWGHNAGWPAGMNSKEHFQAKLWRYWTADRRAETWLQRHGRAAAQSRHSHFTATTQTKKCSLFFQAKAKCVSARSVTRYAPATLSRAHGRPRYGHNIINTSDNELKYLAVSTRVAPELRNIRSPTSSAYSGKRQMPMASRRPSALSVAKRARSITGTANN